VIRTRINRVLASIVATLLERLPSLEQFVSTRVDARRLQIALESLTRRGLRIEVVYDVGAHTGRWTTSVRDSLSGARFFLFEANEAHEAALRDTGHSFFIATLSSEPKIVDFYAVGGQGDSYFREATERYRDVSPQRRQTTTLDDLVAAHELPLPDLIKVDVQGAELDVLRGGEGALGAAKLVLLECPIAEYNEGAPKLEEYVRFMEAHGFAPVELLDSIRRDGRLVQVDVLFARPGSSRD
jgi:FkbM family methyltransferase